MSTPGSPKHGSSSFRDHDTSEILTSNDDHVTSELPELQQQNHRFTSEEESQAQIHETSLRAVDHDQLARAPSVSHLIEKNVQPQEVLHSDSEDVLGNDEPAREQDSHGEEQDSQGHYYILSVVETSKEAVDHDQLSRAPSVSLLIERNVQQQEVLHPGNEDVLGSDEAAREEDFHAEVQDSQGCDSGLAGGSSGGVKPQLQQRRVAVIGAGGFIASWIVNLLLQRGFWVRGTLRNTDDENTAHLRSLEGASERLELLRADILHLPCLVDVVEGCEGVFHTACPVPPTISDPEAQMLRPAVEGTLNVMRASAQAHVKRVVMTSSIGAVYLNPNNSFPHQVLDESCWSDENYLRETKEWYCLAKLMAERAAWEYAGAHGVNLVTICPGVTLGTMLQPRINQSSMHLLKYLDGSTKTYANLWQAYVDVEDAAEAHVLAFVTPSASGRYLCCNWSLHRGDVVRALADICPQYPIPTRCKDEGQSKKVPRRFCNHKVEQQLGLRFSSFPKTLQHSVHSLQSHGMLQHQPSLLDSEHRPHASSTCTGAFLQGSIPKEIPPLLTPGLPSSPPSAVQAPKLLIADAS